MPLIRTHLTETSEVSPNPSSVASVVQVLSASALSKITRRYGKATVTPIRGSSRSQAYRKELAPGQCPSGQTYYSCQTTGFKGCRSINPCDTGAFCPEAKIASSSATPKATSTLAKDLSSASTSSSESSSEQTTTSDTSSAIVAEVSTDPSTTSGASSSATASATSTSSSTTSSAIAAGTLPTAPVCPAGNGTTYTDSDKIAYSVHCALDNSYEPFSRTAVQISGYGQCFSTCSGNSSCAGFTFVGLDDGTCYFKSQIPSSEYVYKNGSNFITCAKVYPSASASQPPAPAMASKKSSGAIIGGVIAGVAALALLLFLVVLIIRRRKNKTEKEHRATITNVLGGAMEPGRDNQTLPMHQRNGSTSHDVFAPYGGFYRGSQAAGYEGHDGRSGEKPHDARSPGKSGYPPQSAHSMLPASLSADMPDALRYVKVADGLYLPPMMYRRLDQGSTDAIPMLDSTLVSRPKSSTSNESGSRYHVHISELEGNQDIVPLHTPPAPPARTLSRLSTAIDADSLTLGRNALGVMTSSASSGGNAGLADQVRRQQHLMSWNDYDDKEVARGNKHGGAAAGMSATMGPRTPPMQRSPDTPMSGVSPDLSNSPLERGFIVSPMGSQAKI